MVHCQASNDERRKSNDRVSFIVPSESLTNDNTLEDTVIEKPTIQPSMGRQTSVGDEKESVASIEAAGHIRFSVDARESDTGSRMSWTSRRRVPSEVSEGEVGNSDSKSCDTASWYSGFVGDQNSTNVTNGENLANWAIRHHRHGLITHIQKKDQNVLSKGSDFLKRHWTKSNADCDHENGDQKEWQRPSKSESFRVSLAEMQRMRLRKLQCRLVNHSVTIQCLGKEPDTWERDLEDYIKAIRDYDYMVQHSQSTRDPFLVSGERMIDDYVIRSALSGLRQDFGTPTLVPGPWEEDSRPIWDVRNAKVAESWLRGFKDRLLMAALGAIFLVGPMWLMVLMNSLYTSLISTTVFVMAFGLVMAWHLENPKEVMSGTAAYAAVLVVFVGLNTA